MWFIKWRLILETCEDKIEKGSGKWLGKLTFLHLLFFITFSSCTMAKCPAGCHYGALHQTSPMPWLNSSTVLPISLCWCVEWDVKPYTLTHSLWQVAPRPHQFDWHRRTDTCTESAHYIIDFSVFPSILHYWCLHFYFLLVIVAMGPVAWINFIWSFCSLLKAWNAYSLMCTEYGIVVCVLMSLGWPVSMQWSCLCVHVFRLSGFHVVKLFVCWCL